jgi:prophage antirepressor-like protein
MSILAVFEFESQEIRFVGDKPVGIDVAKVLGYVDPSKTVSTKVSPENRSLTKMVTVDGKLRDVTVLEEAGIYQLVFSSKLESAKQFQQWVFFDVLPSIRKTGKYEINQQPNEYRPSKALLASREVKEIHENTEDISPRLKQFLIDCCINEVIDAKYLRPADEPKLRGVVEIAQDMGHKVNQANRSQLGRFVKSVVPHLAQTEKRLCNGTEREIAVYPDTDEVRQCIAKYFA